MIGPRKRLKSLLADPLQFRNAPGHCPLCDYRGHFYSYGSPPLPRALCPSCKAGARHRLFFVCLTRLQLWPTGRVLHLAPETALAGHLRERADWYVCADLKPRRVDVACDLHRLCFDDGSFDMIIANHVLEHLRDDRVALLEIARVLAPGGMALLSVPMVWAWPKTYEEPSIASAADRRLHYGQHDHRRLYGRDFPQRVAESGLEVATYPAPTDAVIPHALDRNDALFLARKT